MKKYAIYDFDGTLLLKQTVPHLLKTWKHRRIGLQTYHRIYRWMIRRYLMYKSKLFSLDQKTFRLQAMQRLVELFQLVSLEELGRFFDEAYDRAKPFINKNVIKALKKDKKLGFTTVLLSGNYDVFLERFRHLGFDEIIGTSLYDVNGQLIKQPKIIIGDEKINQLEQRLPSLDWHHTKGYADAYYDRPILSKVAEPICVFPDRKLLKYAKGNGWTILGRKVKAE